MGAGKQTVINYTQLAQGVLWADTQRLKMRKTENKVTGLWFSSDEALSREKSFKTAVFQAAQGTGVASYPTASKCVQFG